MKKVLYAGSFDPMTNGHMDLIERAAKLCDHLVVGVLKNNSKKAFFTTEERRDMIIKCTSHLSNVEVDCFDGLLANYVKENNITAVVRGLRATMDFEYEIQMAQMNARLHKEMETIFLMTSPVYSFLSSSLIKEVFVLDGKVEGLVPDMVLEELKKKRDKGNLGAG